MRPRFPVMTTVVRVDRNLTDCEPAFAFRALLHHSSLFNKPAIIGHAIYSPQKQLTVGSRSRPGIASWRSGLLAKSTNAA